MSIDNQSVTLRSPREAWRHGIAFVSEDRSGQGVILDFSVTENITIGTLSGHRVATHAPFPRRASEARGAHDFIDRLRIKTWDAKSAMRTLSGGNQQKAILARCLAAKPQWPLLDELTHGVDIDIDARQDILALVRNLAAAGIGIVYVSSDFQELLQATTRIVVLRENDLVASFDPAAVTKADLLASCYDNQAFASTMGHCGVRRHKRLQSRRTATRVTDLPK